MPQNIIGLTLLNQYRVDAFVASGGMGAVYRVWDLKRNVPLAMKVLHSELADDPHIFKRFKREANALKKLTHPHIVQFFGLFQTSDLAFLLERSIDGPSLKDILRQKKQFSLEEALIYLKALCAALGYAHANGVVHCDVKPGNVLLDQGGNIYLTDFGIARHAESTTTTMAGAGTAAYMAPEQILGESVTPATDVYALGVMLYEMLTGQRPFRGTESGTERGGDTANERIRYAHLHLQPPDPRSLNPAISGEFAQAMLKAVAKEEEKRYSGVQLFFSEVCKALGTNTESVRDRVVLDNLYAPSNSPVYITPNPLTTPVPQKSFWNRKFISLIGVLSLFVLIGGGLGAIALNRNKSPQAPQEMAIIPSRVEVSTEQPTTSPQFLPTDTPVPATSPDDSSNWIAYAYGTDQDSTDIDPRYLEMVNIQTGEQRRLTFDEGGINFPSFSPRGDQIVYTGCKNNDCKLYVIESSSGIIEKLPGITMKAMWPAWCPDSNKDLIAFEGRVGSNWQIYSIDRSTNKVSALTTGPDDARPEWSPDCTKIVFIRYSGDQGDIYIYDLKEDREYEILNSPNNEFDASWSSDGNYIAFTRVSEDTNGDGFVTLNDRSDLFMINSDGSGETPISKGRYSVFSTSFSSDGKNIVFTNFAGSEQNQQILTYSLTNGNFRIISRNGPFFHTDWSP